jgi:putative DNA methylase
MLGELEHLRRHFHVGHVLEVCRFTYQNLEGHGWAALAKAMVDGGVRPIKAFPLLSDCSSRLHKRERSISWDAVVVCRVDEAGCWNHAGNVDPELGRPRARAWTRRIRTAGLD